jgi:hypothetical protein
MQNQSSSRTPFVVPPALSQTSAFSSHVNDLLQSVQGSSDASSSSLSSAHGHESDHTFTSSNDNIDAKHWHTVHLQQQQQKLAHHPILYPMFSSSLLSQPLPQPSASATEMVANSLTRNSAPVSFVFPLLFR